MTSTAANSAIDIASRALVLIGAEPITAFGSSSTESLVATNMYEDTLRLISISKTKMIEDLKKAIENVEKI